MNSLKNCNGNIIIILLLTFSLIILVIMPHPKPTWKQFQIIEDENIKKFTVIQRADDSYKIVFEGDNDKLYLTSSTDLRLWEEKKLFKWNGKKRNNLPAIIENQDGELILVWWAEHFYDTKNLFNNKYVEGRNGRTIFASKSIDGYDWEVPIDIGQLIMNSLGFKNEEYSCLGDRFSDLVFSQDNSGKYWIWIKNTSWRAKDEFTNKVQSFSSWDLENWKNEKNVVGITAIYGHSYNPKIFKQDLNDNYWYISWNYFHKPYKNTYRQYEELVIYKESGKLLLEEPVHIIQNDNNLFYPNIVSLDNNNMMLFYLESNVGKFKLMNSKNEWSAPIVSFKCWLPNHLYYNKNHQKQNIVFWSNKEGMFLQYSNGIPLMEKDKK